MALRIFQLLGEEFLPYFTNEKKKSIHSQFRDLRALYREYGIFPYHYFKHRLYESDATDCTGYVPGVLVKRFQEYANPISHIENLSNKSMTLNILNSANIPVVQDLFVVDEYGEYYKNGENISQLEAIRIIAECPQQIFAKPLNSGGGKGTKLIST
jgi:hypothetical protein